MVAESFSLTLWDQGEFGLVSFLRLFSQVFSSSVRVAVDLKRYSYLLFFYYYSVYRTLILLYSL